MRTLGCAGSANGTSKDEGENEWRERKMRQDWCDPTSERLGAHKPTRKAQPGAWGTGGTIFSSPPGGVLQRVARSTTTLYSIATSGRHLESIDHQISKSSNKL